MAKANKSADEQAVADHIKKLDPEIQAMVNEIRKIILAVDKEVSERIKWNNPSFYYSGDMKPFDPKEYKREIAVFNLFKGRVMLVFPTGAKIKDGSGLLTGDYKDGRRLLLFADLKDVKARKKGLIAIVRTWLSLVEK